MNKIGLVLLLSVIATGCSSTQGSRFELIEKYQLNDVKQSSHGEYQKEVRKRLRENWQALLDSNSDLPVPSIVPGVDAYAIEQLVNINSPTDQKAHCQFADGKPRGMLLIHGLYDSPYTMRDLQAYFQSKCFYTRSILLPGHGTRPGSLLKIKFESWMATVNFAIAELAKEVDGNVYIAGFSTGGALALNSAFEDPRVKGLFLFAPAIKVDAELAYKVKKLGLDWVPFHQLADKDAVKYESLTLDSVIAVDRLAKMVKSKLQSDDTNLDIPVFLAVAESDFTIKSKTVIDFYRQGRFGKQSEMLIYSPETVSAGDPDKLTPTYVNSRFVHQQNDKQFLIVDYSHMALTLKPTDAHYGLEGRYINCLQYFLDSKKQRMCEDVTLEFPKVCFGERKAIGSQSYAQCRGPDKVVRRLTSNPQFDGMAKLMDGFIHRYIDR